jgi:hypothetical protein
VFGKTDAEKLLNKVFEEETVKKEVKTETNKRISRMTPTLANQLKAELIKVGLTFSDDDKKASEKLKKEFVAHVDGLTDEDFTAKGLADHMRDFANLKKPAPAPAEKQEEEKPKKGKAKKEDPAPAEKKEEEKPKKGKAAAKKETTPAAAEKKKTLWEEMNEVKAPPPPSNAANIVELTLKELQDIKIVASWSDPHLAGVYWDADNGRVVRGPDEDDDEDHDEKKFNGKTYAVGERTGRVYETTDDRDIFVGFAGVGPFRELK